MRILIGMFLMLKRPAIFLLVLCCLFGCSSFALGAASSPIKLNALLEDHPTVRVIAKLLPEFESATGIEVDIEVIPFEAMTHKAGETLRAGSEKYDIYMDGWVNAFEWAVSRHLEPLDQFFTASSSYPELDRGDFIEAYLNDARHEGHFYGLPVYGESTFLFYRRDIFAELGLEPPQTMEDIERAARIINEKNPGIIPITLRGRPGVHIAYAWSSFLWAFGGRWLDEHGRLDIASPEAIRSAQFFGDLLRNYGPAQVEEIGWEENRDLFLLGRAAMTIDATVNAAFNEEGGLSRVAGKVGYLATPVASGALLMGGQCSMITHQLYLNRYGKKKEAAFRFIAWATSAKNQLRSIEIMPSCGITSQTALNSEIFASRYHGFSKSIVTALENGNADFLPRMKQVQTVYRKVGDALLAIVKGKVKAEEILPEITREINDQLADLSEKK